MTLLTIVFSGHCSEFVILHGQNSGVVRIKFAPSQINVWKWKGIDDMIKSSCQSRDSRRCWWIDHIMQLLNDLEVLHAVQVVYKETHLKSPNVMKVVSKHKIDNGWSFASIPIHNSHLFANCCAFTIYDVVYNDCLFNDIIGILEDQLNLRWFGN